MSSGIFRMMRVLVTVPLILAFLILMLQSRLIYYPRDYNSQGYREIATSVEQISHEFRGKKQVAFLLGDTTSPEKVWFIFGGNGSLALDWAGMFPSGPEVRNAFLLVDYPGYGFSEGRPNPKRIQAAIASLLPAVAKHLQISEEELHQRAATLGHSIGCAVALKAAETHGWKEVVLISPFTSMLDMARRTIGPGLCQLLTHRFDNRGSLKAWVEQTPDGPPIRIYHGGSDDLIPSRMSEELRDLAPDRVELTLIPGAGHNDVVLALEGELLGILAATGGG